MSSAFFEPAVVPIIDQSSFYAPLTPRSANAQSLHTPQWSQPKILSPMPLSPPETPSKSDHSSLAIPTSRSRAALPQSRQINRPARESVNPLTRSSEQRTVDRRNRFFAHSRERRDNARWEIRGEQILRKDFIEERRAWEQQLSASAPHEMLDYDSMDVSQMADNTYAVATHSTVSTDVSSYSKLAQGVDVSPEEAELEAMLKAEQEELEAQLSLQEEGMGVGKSQSRSQQSLPALPSSPTRYGSDDEDLFADFLEDDYNDMDTS